MHIRTATINDVKAVTDLEAVCFPPAEAADEASFQNRLETYPNHFWLLEDGDVLVGFVNGMVSDESHLLDEMFEHAELHQEDGDWQFIFGVNTSPTYRCQGCAEKILRKVIEEAQLQGRKGLVLTCKDQLVHYYAKFGFIEEGMSDSTHGGVSWHEMRLTF